ncbi:MAG TPA: NADH-quinone oxidoreductase subunit L [Mycobacteriales bacterium]|nr:NADH-quinone oxidoreductase subunit L [Mycobacteriales bacterium]
MIRAAWLLPALPFLAALIGGFLPRRVGSRLPAVVAVTGTAASLVLAVPLLVQTAGRGGAGETTHVIAPNAGVGVTAGTLANGLAGLLTLVVCVVALLVQLYSVEYLHDDTRYPAYAAEVSLFTAAMLAVVLAADLLVLLIGWEVMGLCSYLLIGHYRQLPEAPGAALKAFLVTRVGDVGFLLGILLLGLHAGTFRITGVLAAVPSLSSTTLTTGTLLLLLGVAGKSAQFPLHTWLPDAMAGPTPISALIHAATMVAAGVYVVLRLYPAFAAAPATLAVLGCLAAITMLLGALAALGQDDVKRVLAWSTVSQLAYMLGALAVGGVGAGAFHLITHAAFKALLFLCAGVLLHETGSVLMSRLGGLRRQLPVTYTATVLGGLALIGLPPLSGGLSKDAVLEAAWAAARGHGPVGVDRWVGVLVLASALATVVVTAAYLTRLILRTFHGEPRSDFAAHEPGRFMRWPIQLLALAAVLVGIVGLRSSWLPSWLGVPDERLSPQAGMTAVALALAAIGVLTVGLSWRRAPADDPVRFLGTRAVAALHAGFYLDTMQDRLVVRPVLRVARAVSTADRVLVDGAVESTEPGSQWLGRSLARLEAGNVQLYLTGMAAAAIILAAAVAVVS